MLEAIALTRGVPAEEALPAAKIGEALEAALQKNGPVILQYGNIGGYPPLRQYLAEQYKVNPNEILIGNGSLHLQDLFAGTVIKPGDTVLTEQPSYDRAIKTFRRRGAKVYGVPMEADGLNLALLEEELKRQVPAFLYIVPDFQNPAGLSTSYEKRKALVELADKYNFWIIEDVPYRNLRYRGEAIPLLREINPAHIVTMSSFSKLISPALRVGYMVAPADLIARVTRLAEETILSPVLPTQAVVAEFVQRGWLDENIASLKALYEPRLDAMIAAIRKYLPDVTFTPPDGGFFVSIVLPETANYANLVERAQAVKLALTDGKTFFADPLPGQDDTVKDRFVRLPFCAITPAQIEEGVRRLAELVK
ncbi:MAG: aspartate aminotransferase [Chloroflexi bacterium 54-19]|nr:MAG: aspartate aminotransferase [Chloroflexi bacterium 54-19]